MPHKLNWYIQRCFSNLPICFLICFLGVQWKTFLQSYIKSMCYSSEVNYAVNVNAKLLLTLSISLLSLGNQWHWRFACRRCLSQQILAGKSWNLCAHPNLGQSHTNFWAFRPACKEVQIFWFENLRSGFPRLFGRSERKI